MASLYVFLAVVVFSLVGITLVSALEKRLVWPYVPVDAVPPDCCPPPTPYALEAAEAAASAGFSWVGTFADGKGKLYRLRYSFFRSPAGDTLALVGTGAMASVPVQTTWLFTLLAGGRCLVTVDHQTGGEIDLAGLAEEALIAGRGFAGQAAAHQARLAAAGTSALLFEETAPLAAFHAYRQRRIERLAALGYASFLDSDRTAWRYSPQGAALLAFRQYFTGLRRFFVPDSVRVAPGSVAGTDADTSVTAALPFVQTTALLVFVYSLLLLVNAAVFAALRHHAALLSVGVFQAILGLLLRGSLSQLKRWAWWTVTGGGILFGLRDVVGLLADGVRLVKHLPLPHPEFAAVHVLGVLLVWPIVIRLLRKRSRRAFGFSPLGGVFSKQPAPGTEPTSAGVWPPPPSTPTE